MFFYRCFSLLSRLFIFIIYKIGNRYIDNKYVYCIRIGYILKSIK